MKMTDGGSKRDQSGVVWASGEAPVFRAGDRVRVDGREPVGHYRVPRYLRGKVGTVESVIEPMSMDNEEEAYGRNAGRLLHYYRIAFAMTELWAGYVGASDDQLRIEVFEKWLEKENP